MVTLRNQRVLRLDIMVSEAMHLVPASHSQSPLALGSSKIPPHSRGEHMATVNQHLFLPRLEMLGEL